MEFANFIRLSCGMPWSPKIEQAISVLGGLVRQLRGIVRQRFAGGGRNETTTQSAFYRSMDNAKCLAESNPSRLPRLIPEPTRLEPTLVDPDQL